MSTPMPGPAAGGPPHDPQQHGLQAVLMVETRSLWESADVNDFLDMAHSFIDAGLQVDLFLVQNSVLMLRSAARERIGALAGNGACRIWIDRYALGLRGMTADDAAGCGAIAGTDELVRLMTVPHTKIIWHS